MLPLSMSAFAAAWFDLMLVQGMFLDTVGDGFQLPIAGAGANDTAHAVHLTKSMKSLGATGVLSVTPYYNRPSQAGIEGHFRAVAAATDLPVILYDIPIRTGRKISTETLIRLANDVAAWLLSSLPWLVLLAARRCRAQHTPATLQA